MHGFSIRQAENITPGAAERNYKDFVPRSFIRAQQGITSRGLPGIGTLRVFVRFAIPFTASRLSVIDRLVHRQAGVFDRWAGSVVLRLARSDFQRSLEHSTTATPRRLLPGPPAGLRRRGIILRRSLPAWFCRFGVGQRHSRGGKTSASGGRLPGFGP